MIIVIPQLLYNSIETIGRRFIGVTQHKFSRRLVNLGSEKNSRQWEHGVVQSLCEPTRVAGLR